MADHATHLGTIGLVFCLAAPVPLAAQTPQAGTFIPPPGCEGFLTVQSRGCRVSNHYRCEADPKGHQWRADFDQEGIFFISRTDAEAQWIESYDMFPTVRQTLDPNPDDPASFSTLLDSGIDTFAFGLTKDTGAKSRVTGFDRLTGRSVSIDGVTLQETEFKFAESDADGNPIRSAQGREYIHPDWRLFFAGPSEWDSGDGPVPVDGSPRLFIQPGEPGFFATTPIFECDDILSSLPVQTPRPAAVHPETPEEPSDDDL